MHCRRCAAWYSGTAAPGFHRGWPCKGRSRAFSTALRVPWTNHVSTSAHPVPGLAAGHGIGGAVASSLHRLRQSGDCSVKAQTCCHGTGGAAHGRPYIRPGKRALPGAFCRLGGPPIRGHAKTRDYRRSRNNSKPRNRWTCRIVKERATRLRRGRHATRHAH